MIDRYTEVGERGQVGIKSLIIGVCLLLGYGMTNSVRAQADFGPCTETMYMNQGESGTMTLYEFDTSNNPFVYDVIGSQGTPYYNGTGYNPNDNYLYAIQQSDDNFVRVGDDGQAVDLGPVSGLPESVGTAYFGGEIGPDGSYYVMQGGGQSTLYVIDISTQSVTNTVSMTQPLNTADMAWHDGLLYTVNIDDSNLYSIDPVNGNVTQIGSVGSGLGTFGAMFGATNGIFGVSNDGNGFFKFNISTGEATQISDSPGSNNNDGAKCVTTALAFPGDLTMDKDDGATTYVPGESVTYTLTVSNNGPFGAQGAVVNDPLPAGIPASNASWTCNATDGGTCGTSSGTGEIDGILVNLPYDSDTNTGGTATFSLTIQVPSDYTGDLVNTATVDPSNTTTDSDLTNNDDDDTNTADPSADLALTKDLTTSGPFYVGDEVQYTVTVDNLGSSDASNVEINDTPTNLTITDVAGSSCTSFPCTIGTLGAGDQTTVTVTGTIDAAGAFGNTGNVTSDTPDPDTNNNDDSTSNTADPAADVSLTKTLDTAGPYNAGQQVEYTITINNDGPSEATDIEVTDTPTNLTIDNVSGSGCGAFPCTIPSLADGNQTTISVTGTIDATGAFDNEATATPAEEDPTPANNTDNDGNTADPSTDIALTKTLDTAGPFVAGQQVDYTITIDNNGPSEATDIEVTDTATNLNISNVSGSGCSSFPCTVPSLAVGSQTTINVTGTIETAGTFGNTATATPAEEDPTPGNNTDSAEDTADPSADIVVEKTLQTQGPYNAGQSVDYQLTITNDGPSDASNVEVTDTPVNFSITDVSGAGCSNFPCSIASLADGDAVIITVTGTIDSEGDFNNTATATADQNDPDETNNSDNDGGNSEPAADMAVTKVLDTQGPFNAGDNVSFTVNVSNNGPSQATGIVVDDVPTNLTLTGVSGSGCSSFPCTIGSLGNGAVTSLQVTATIDAAGTFSNQATVTANEFDPNQNNNEDTTSDNGNAAADVAVDKILDTAGPYLAGQEVTYTVRVQNNGPSDAQNVTVTDTPTNLTVTDASSPNCNTFPCTLEVLGNGEQEEITVTATINGEGAFTNASTVNSDTDDPNPDNNTDDEDDNGGTANPSADIVVDKTLDTSGPYYAGNQISYTLTLTNQGPSDATNIDVTDTPTNLSIDNVTGACSTLPCSIASLSSGDETSITIQATINAAGAFDNTATATPAENDPTPENNTDNEGNGGSADPAADIEVTKTLVTDGPYNAGEPVTFEILVANNGPSDATSINVTDSPTNITLNTISGACSTLPCTIPALASGEETMITVEATINDAGSFSNIAKATAREQDPIPENNSDRDGDSGGLLADLSLTKTIDTPGPYVDGQQIQFTITVSNAGPSEATGALVIDTPTNLTVDRVRGACSTLPCDLSSIPAGEQREIRLLATIDEPGAFNNVATINAAQEDPTPENNTDGDGGNSAASADVSVSKTLDTAGPYVDGQQVQYSMLIRNEGPSAATNVEVVDTPTNLRINNVNGACTILPCTIPAIPAGEQRTIIVMGSIQNPGTFDNTVTASPEQDDPTPSNNTDDAGNGGSANASSDIAITKSVDNATPKVGEQVTFTLSALNHGPSDGEGVEASDMLPSGYSFVSSSPSVGSYDEDSGTWSIGSLAENASATLDITATVLNTGEYANTTSITSETPDPDPNNNTGTSTPDPSPTADLAVTKVLNTSGPYAAGQQLDYTITINNNGPSQATGIEVTDSPTNLTINNVSGSGCSSFPCTIASLASGSETEINVIATINAEGAFGNTATATGNEDDPNPDNNTDRDGDNGGESTDVSITKTLVTEGPFTDGQQIEYSLSIANNGPSDATGVLVKDSPTNLIINEVQGACTSLPCTIASIPNGQEENLTVLATIDGTGPFDNVATAVPTEDDPDPSNNTDEGGNGGSADASADLGIRKTLTTTAPYSAGQQIEYDISVVNNGPSTATDVSVTESPTNLTINSVSGSGCTNFPCTIASLAADQQASISVMATIDDEGEFNNVATTTSEVDDPDQSNNTDEDPDNGGTSNAAVDVSLTKTLATTGPYQANQQVKYSLLIANDGPSEATNIDVTDTPENLTIAGVSGAGCSSLPCTLPSLAAGSQTTIDVIATIDAPGEFTNTATATPAENDADNSNNTDSNGGTANAEADISIAKSLQTPAPYKAGQEVTYRLTVHNDGPSVATNVNVTDTPENLSLSTVSGACAELPCRIETLEVGEQQTIDVKATIDGGGEFTNIATAESEDFEDPILEDNTDNDNNNSGIAQAVVDVSVDKILDTEGPFTAGQELEYTITVGNAGPSTATEVRVTDTPTNLDISNVTGAGCSSFPCTIASIEAGTEVELTVLATIQEIGPFDNSAAAEDVENDSNPDNNTDDEGNGGTANPPELRIIKQVENLTVQPGGFVPYSITVDNLSDVPVNDVQIIDTPALGLSYVQKSLGIADEDDSGLIEGIRPLIIGDIDLAPGGQAEITYIMRVGATALPGELRNLAVASKNGTQLSEEDDASIMLEGDPIIDETRILGTVFRDHDRDGYQDIATASGIRVKGGFTPGVYVDGSTTVDFGDGPVAVADASAPLLRGLDLGDLQGHHSLSSSPEDYQIVVSQHVSEPEFTDDFELTTDEGTTLNMTASGNLSRQVSGAVKRDVNSQHIQVERTVTELANGQYRVDYIITNAGFDDWGLPGARLSTPRGLVVETDGYGRYHIEAVETGSWRRGRNFIVKVDNSSLPRSSSYTTENPLVRRITNAAPVRFDFGIYIPTADLAIEKTLLTNEPYEVGDSIEYNLNITNNGPATAHNVKVDDYGQNISIMGIEGSGCAEFPCTIGEPLVAGASINLRVTAKVDSVSAFANKAAALADEDDPRPDNNIDLVSTTLGPDTTTVTKPEAEPVTGCEEAVMIPRAIHFETDKSFINRAAAQMLDRVAAFMLKRKDCSIGIIGHTDHDLSYEYNKDLSLRRARAIRAYLQASGVEAEHITLDGVSFSQPAVQEEDILDKALNRRTSFSFSPSSDDTLLQQLEDLQVDPEPEAWDYIFDFRHNAVPGQLHFVHGKASLNKITRYIIKRIALVMESYSTVNATFSINPSGRAGLAQQRTKALRSELASTGLAASRYEIVVDSIGSQEAEQAVYISYTPNENLITVPQDDDVRLNGVESYLQLIDKAWEMLQTREDQSLYHATPDSLQPPVGIKLSVQNETIDVEAAAGLSRLGSYLLEHPQQEVVLSAKPPQVKRLMQARKYLTDWGIEFERVSIVTEGDTSLPDHFIRFKTQQENE